MVQLNTDNNVIRRRTHATNRGRCYRETGAIHGKSIGLLIALIFFRFWSVAAQHVELKQTVYSVAGFSRVNH